MANVLNEEKKQEVLALGRLGWSLRRIQQECLVVRQSRMRSYRESLQASELGRVNKAYGF